MEYRNWENIQGNLYIVVVKSNTWKYSTHILEMPFCDSVNVNCTNVNKTEVPILTYHVVSKTCNNYRSKFLSPIRLFMESRDSILKITILTPSLGCIYMHKCKTYLICFETGRYYVKWVVWICKTFFKHRSRRGKGGGWYKKRILANVRYNLH